MKERYPLGKYRLYTTVLFDNISEDYFYIPSGEFSHYTDDQLVDHLSRLRRHRAGPEEIKDPLCEFRDRILRNRSKDKRTYEASAFFSTKRYLQQRFFPSL